MFYLNVSVPLTSLNLIRPKVQPSVCLCVYMWCHQVVAPTWQRQVGGTWGWLAALTEISWFSVCLLVKRSEKRPGRVAHTAELLVKLLLSYGEKKAHREAERLLMWKSCTHTHLLFIFLFLIFEQVFYVLKSKAVDMLQGQTETLLLLLLMSTTITRWLQDT